MPTAFLEEHVYCSFPRDVPFWIARCDHPSHGPIALNSGHHYTEDGKHHAEALIARHDAEEHPALSTGEFAHLERLFAEATAAVKAAQAAERAAFQALHEARCNADFGPGPRGGMWRCTLQDDHAGDHSNVFSRGEA